MSTRTTPATARGDGWRGDAASAARLEDDSRPRTDFVGGNIRNIELLDVVYRARHGPPAAESAAAAAAAAAADDDTDNASPVVREGFSSDEKYVMRMAYKFTFRLPVTVASTFQPTKFVENERTNKGLYMLAHVSLPNIMLGKALKKTEDTKKAVNNNVSVDASGNLHTSVDPDASISDEQVSRFLDGAESGDMAKNDPNLKQFLDAKNSQSQSVGDMWSDLLRDDGDFDLEQSANAQGSQMGSDFNSATGAEGAPADPDAAAAANCPQSADTSNFLRDCELIKKYAYKTIVLLISFLTAINVSYWLFVGLKDPLHSEEACEVANMLTNDPAELIPPPNAGNKSLFFISHVMNLFIWATELLGNYNPYQYTIMFITQMQRWITNFANIFPEKKYGLGFDHKVWTLLLIYVCYQMNLYVFGNYETYMSDYRRQSSNILSSFVSILYLIFWKRQFTTKLFLTVKDSYTMFTSFPGFITVLLYNIYLFICMYYTSFTAVFLMLIGYLFFTTIGILFAQPGPMAVFQNMALVQRTVDAAATAKLNTTPKGWKKKLLRLVHNIADNKFFVVTLVWLIYVFRIFHRELTTKMLRQNMFLCIAAATVALILYKLILGAFSAGEVTDSSAAKTIIQNA